MLKASLNNRLQCSAKSQSAQPVRTKPLFALIMFGLLLWEKVAIFQDVGWFRPDPEGGLYYLVLLLCYYYVIVVMFTMYLLQIINMVTIY